MPVAPSPRPFVGRARELSELAAGLEAARSGRGSLFLLAGEAGIGKTRLSDELSQSARDGGFGVYWGRSWEVGGAPAYWPWILVLRGLVRDAARLGLGESRVRALSRLLPELGDDAEPPSAELDQARFQLFDSVARALHEASLREPLLVVLEDLHAANPSSLALLLFVAQGLRGAALCVVGTYRADEVRLEPERVDVLRRISREGSCLTLRRFDRVEVLGMLSGLADAPSDALLGEVCRATEGHPLFVDEVRRMLLGRAPGEPPLSRLSIPENVRSAISERLARLDADARALVEVAAVIGRELTLSTLAGALGLERARLSETTRRALAAGVLVELTPEAYAFSHALVRDALLNELSKERLSELHTLAADVLEQSGAPEAALGEVALHLLAAQGLVGAERALSGARRAAERAMSAFAFEDAAAIVERALEVIAESDCDRRLWCECLLLLGEAQVRAHRDGHAACERAAELARSLGDAELSARAALALGAEISIGEVNRALLRLLEAALGLLPEQPSRLRARVLARLAGALQPAADPRIPIELARRAIAMARELGHDETLLSVLIGAGSALIDYADVAERLDVDRETLLLAERARDRARCFRAQLRLFFDYSELGSSADAAAALRACQALGPELGRPRYLFHLALMQASDAARGGRFAEALGFADEARNIAQRADDPLLPISLAFFGYALRVAARDDAALLECVPSYATTPLPPVGAQLFRSLMLALACARRGLGPLTKQHLSQVPWQALQQNLEIVPVWLYAEACLCLPEPFDAEALLTALLPQRGRFVCWGVFGAATLAPYSLTLGRLCQRLGRAEDAQSYLEEARAQCLACGALPALAEVELYLASWLLENPNAERRARATTLLASAKEFAQRAKMSGLLRQLEASQAPTEASGDSLALTLTPTGDVFRVEYSGRVCHVKDTRGMRLLADLLANPGRELHVLTLVGADEHSGRGDAGSVLDSSAIAAYRRRLAQLREQEQLVEELSDASRLDRVRSEIDALAQQLSEGLGLGGRGRRAGSHSERARVNVQRRLRDAIHRIEEQDPALGRALDLSVTTGTFCCFDPRRWPKYSD
ncbi:MAG: AAA family ATPase [Polyangiaceae bacterium]